MGIQQHKIGAFLGKMGIFLLLVCCVFSCARQMRPTGGDRDFTPPELIRTIPDNQSLNYTDGEVRFFFSEAIKKVSYNKEVFISPLLDQKPKLSLNDSQKRLKVTFDEELRENTTYVISLNEVGDNTENNKLEGSVSFAFSTGDQLDSMGLRGRVFSAVVGVPKEEILLMLFDADSIEGNDIFRKRPAYIAKTNKTGDFSFQYLRDAPFKLYGIEDKDQSVNYSQPSETVAIADTAIAKFNDPNDSTFSTQTFMYAFVPDEAAPILRDYDWINDTVIACTFNEGYMLDSLELSISDTLLEDFQSIDSYTYVPSSNHELLIELPRDREQYSELRFVHVRDSLGNQMDSVLSIKPGSIRKDQKAIFKSLEFNVEREKMEFYLPFILPKADSVKIFITDTTRYFSALDTLEKFTDKEDGEYLYRQDVEFQQEAFKFSLVPGDTVDLGKQYIMHIDGSLFGEKADTVYRYKLSFPNPEDFGTLNGAVRIKGYDGPVIVQLMSKKKILQTAYDTTFNFRFVKPGDVSARVILDVDSNRIWTTGSLENYRLPEKILVGKETINVRANWDLEEFIVILDEEKILEEMLVAEKAAREEEEARKREAEERKKNPPKPGDTGGIPGTRIPSGVRNR